MLKNLSTTYDFKSAGRLTGYMSYAQVTTSNSRERLKTSVRRSGGFAIRRQKMFDLFKSWDL